MKTKIIVMAIVATCMISCVSENEQKGLDYISTLYNAQTSYTKSFKSEAGSENTKTFNVKVSDSDRIDSLQPTVTTANIAMLMYESFTEKEKKAYTHIDVEVISKKNDTAAYVYPIALLQSISKKSKNYKLFSQSLVDGEFGKADEIKDPNEIPNAVADGLKALIGKLEKDYGALTGYESFGVGEAKDEQGTIYQFQGYLVFSDGHRQPYFTVADATSGKDKLIGFKIF